MKLSLRFNSPPPSLQQLFLCVCVYSFSHIAFPQVSAFSTWEKELPKFVFDPRCMLLNTKERKVCFEAFIRSRAEEERKERKSKLKEKKDQFRALLEESRLHPRYTVDYTTC